MLNGDHGIENVRPTGSGRLRALTSYDVLIAGAGPAGLFAALSLAAAGMRRVLLVDAGPAIGERRRPAGRSATEKQPRPDYERGVGGAGLFSDGKLCLSLGVGGHLETELGDGHRAELERDIETILLSLVDGPVERSEADGRVGAAAANAGRAGLSFKYYPVAHIGTDRCSQVVERLHAQIDGAGIEIRARSELLSVDEGSGAGPLVATVRGAGGERQILARHVVLALGKVGASRQAAICARLGIELSGQRLYAGVRFEAAASRVEPLFALTKDPKYSLPLADGSKIKTHCATRHGEVLTLRYEGLPLAGGHNHSRARSARSGFSILWDGIDPGEDSYATALAMMGAAAGRVGGPLTVQTLSDLRRGESSTARSIAGIDVTCRDAVPGDLRRFMPPQYFDHLDAFLGRLTQIAPTIAEIDAVAYGPAIEWWMKRVAVTSPWMTTSVRGLSVCGDGSGWSQGIVHAAATGLLAAAGIHRRSVCVREWVWDQQPVPGAPTRDDGRYQPVPQSRVVRSRGRTARGKRRKDRLPAGGSPGRD